MVSRIPMLAIPSTGQSVLQSLFLLQCQIEALSSHLRPTIGLAKPGRPFLFR